MRRALRATAVLSPRSGPRPTGREAAVKCARAKPIAHKLHPSQHLQPVARNGKNFYLMAMSDDWDFYGRRVELEDLRKILARERWFFTRITGRRRIGKTSLVQQVLPADGKQILYCQIPDSAPAGVLAAIRDAAEIFRIDEADFPHPRSLAELATWIEQLAAAGYVVALDEFQYFSRKHLHEFTSHLQGAVDRLAARSDEVHGGLLVLGSLHAEITALLDDRSAPLYNRTTDAIELGHLDVGSILEILRTHSIPEPEQLLFVWNLFEGVPKFYRDCFEQETFRVDRPEFIERMFFRSSAPLRNEADNWFLHEFRGRYDVILKFIARHPGATNGEIRSHVGSLLDGDPEQVGGYLKVLVDRYRIIEKRQPVFSRPRQKNNRFYLTDNFLRSWVHALASHVNAARFRPVEELVGRADDQLRHAEGHGFERLVGQLYEERSRKAVGDFPLSARIQGYWNNKGTEIDLVAISEDLRVVRFGTCKRSQSKLLPDLANHRAHVERFLEAFPQYRDWTHEYVALAPVIEPEVRAQIESAGHIAQDLRDLTEGL